MLGISALHHAKRAFRARFPRLVEHLYTRPRRALLQRCPALLASTFERIYDGNAWEGVDSLSGRGSDLDSTARIREALPGVLARIGARSLLDAPCGDGFWISHVALDLDRYIGIDLVPRAVAECRTRMADARSTVFVGDMTRGPLPRCDAILCRDGLVHLGTRQIVRALRNFRRSGARHLITTTFPGLAGCNREIITGEWRPLDLQAPPFNFPEPIVLINEGLRGAHAAKSLGVWRLDDLPV